MLSVVLATAQQVVPIGFLATNKSLTENVSSRPGENNPYCVSSLCPRGKRHVACEKSFNNYHRSCMHEPQFVNLTGHVDKILKYHNEWRHRLANGNNVTLPRAARMVVMHWSDELATVASYNVRMCQARHDDCRNTHNFTHSGQNIIVFNMTRLVQDELLESLYPELLSIGVRNWWSEHNNMTRTDVELYPCDKKRQQYYQHFAVMALESNSHVGCAAVRYVIKDVTYFKVTCNYAKDTVCGQPIYSFRTVGCLTGVNAKYKSLCSEKEVFA
ncbi:venom allergen-1 [Drosophila tropicalis]|uniref:venom allergen-1 n=1 Tax=Drosophila tropicalis TaxID=46794 RepID=UPI0035ABC182